MLPLKVTLSPPELSEVVALSEVEELVAMDPDPDAVEADVALPDPDEGATEDTWIEDMGSLAVLQAFVYSEAPNILSSIR